MPKPKDKFVIKDSGERQKFSTGAERDSEKGKGRFDLIPPYALLRLARVYEKGATKYDDRNWELGMPTSRCVESALRHLNQYLGGMRDEDHLGHAVFNIFAIMFMEKFRPELDDLPKEERYA